MAHRSGSIQATLGWSSGDMNGVVGHASCLRYLLFDISKRKAHDCTLICIYIPTEPHTYLLFWGWKQPISCIYIQKPTWLHPFWTEHPKPTKTRFSPKYPGYFEDPAFSWCIGLEGNYIYISHTFENSPQKNLNRRTTQPVAFPRQGTCPLRPAVGNATSLWRWRWETAGGYVGSFENGHWKSLDILKSFINMLKTPLNMFKQNQWLILDIVDFYRKTVAWGQQSLWWAIKEMGFFGTQT